MVSLINNIQYFILKSKPPVKLVVCSDPIRVYYLWLHLKRCSDFSLTITLFSLVSPFSGLFYFTLFSLVTCKRVYIFFQTYLLYHHILFYLILYILFYCSFISSHCIYIISSTPKMSIPIFIL